MRDLFGEEMEILLPHIEDSIRNGDFEMNANGLVQFFTIVAMWAALTVDPLCEELEIFANDRAWNAAMDAYSERIKAVPVHTPEHRFCLMSDCPCHDEEEV
jgi:hypothetical protein